MSPQWFCVYYKPHHSPLLEALCNWMALLLSLPRSVLPHQRVPLQLSTLEFNGGEGEGGERRGRRGEEGGEGKKEEAEGREEGGEEEKKGNEKEKGDELGNTSKAQIDFTFCHYRVDSSLINQGGGVHSICKQEVNFVCTG